jgi:curved DNA-binding protein CbpA
VEPEITWYEVLGVLPDAATADVRSGYDAKANLLRPEFFGGAPSTVLNAAERARAILDAAWSTLGDPAKREAYDEAVGITRVGEGLAAPYSGPSEAGWDPSSYDFVAGSAGGAMIGAMMAVADFLGPQPDRQSSRIAVPDLRGLFYQECLQIVGKVGLRISVVRLTAHPMPVDGLVVDQSPAPQAKAHRESTLTLQVWHPPQTRA